MFDGRDGIQTHACEEIGICDIEGIVLWLMVTRNTYTCVHTSKRLAYEVPVFNSGIK